MFKRDRLVLWALSALVLVVSVGLIWAESHPDYRRYQAEFRQLVTARLGAERAARIPEGPQQIWLASTGQVDRCPSCHLGTTWKDLEGAPQPFSPHPEKVLAKHPLEKFGCSACHGGQGAATRLPDAHGWVAHWEEPLLDRTLGEEYGVKEPAGFVQMRCNGCHRYEAKTEGAELINLAKGLVDKKGCRACHVINGRGGAVGPDLTRVGDKPAEQYDFARLTSLKSLFAWHVGHLGDPKAFTPGSLMPQFGLASRDAQALALLLLSWRDRRIPAEYLPGAPLTDVPSPEQAERERQMREGDGRFFVEKTCFACHDVSVLGIESAAKIGPDLSIAVEDVQNRFGRSLEDFLRAPTGTMQVVLSRQIQLSPAELDEAIRLLKVAFEKHQKAAAGKR